jgi:uncharacterized protein
MRFIWNKAKAGSNLKKHGVAFEEALTVFCDPLAATFADPDHSTGEDRFITVGWSIRKRLLLVAYTEQEDKVRIISARCATAAERQRHENA